MKRKQRGVTLIELMMVIAIVGVLSAIAIPTYHRYVVRSNRTDAKTALTQMAQRYERCYTNSTPYAYDGATCTATVTHPYTVDSGTYQIDASFPTSQSYALTATPQGAQFTDDTECGTFTLTQTGAQTVSGSLSATPERCWRR